LKGNILYCPEKGFRVIKKEILLNIDDEIVLIDEPELGLNPLVKQEFLKFLLTESKERQIFIATQDFVNL